VNTVAIFAAEEVVIALVAIYSMLVFWNESGRIRKGIRTGSQAVFALTRDREMNMIDVNSMTIDESKDGFEQDGRSFVREECRESRGGLGV
jgi:Fe2+ or Zn2+ uptake regulation protein